MRMTGVEPARAVTAHEPLKLARLPIPPHPRGTNAGDRSRTCTGRKAHDRLRVARLPIPPHPRKMSKERHGKFSALCQLSYPAITIYNITCGGRIRTYNLGLLKQ